MPTAENAPNTRLKQRATPRRSTSTVYIATASPNMSVRAGAALPAKNNRVMKNWATTHANAEGYLD